jgi:signal transduction histidine kinase/CheY-like chemotaxis protein
VRTDVEHLRALYVQTPATLTGNLIGMLLMTAIYGSLTSPARVWGWLGVGALLWLLRLAHYRRFRAQTAAAPETLRRWHASWAALVLGQGALWGVAVWLFWGLGTPYHVVSLILIVVSYCLGSVQLLSTQPRMFLAFITVVLAPAIARIATDEAHPWRLQLALVLTLLFGITVLMGRTHASALNLAIDLKARTEELAAQLRREMLAAETARRAAEAATRAKTQFFAAASHDLRQPLHAMGLFAEALRARSHDAQAACLVNSINESVDALEGLFAELLDITRLDSGNVDVHPQPLRLRELHARLRLHFEPVALEKGLMLGFRGEHHTVLADPVLLERVLRNLVSNAIRYTEDGGVLVTARPRAGQVLLQVWDTGIGLSEENLPRIWDEFYQAEGQPPLGAHQRKGLGLGLAIVKRLAVLMNAPLAVRSRLGRGTVFSILVPRAKAPVSVRDPPGAASGARATAALTLQGRLVLVLEDDAAVREGLVVLLQSWHARVLAFEALQPLQAWLASDAAERPDLLLVDSRLPQGRTGVEALVVARARWAGAHLPAIVVTATSQGGHEKDAAAHDYHLLIKPVLPHKLRAMMAFKLAQRPSAAPVTSG